MRYFLYAARKKEGKKQRHKIAARKRNKKEGAASERGPLLVCGYGTKQCKLKTERAPSNDTALFFNM